MDEKSSLVEIFSNKHLTLVDLQNTPNKVSLVNNCEKLAEKVEPGYLVKLAGEIEKANSLVFHTSTGKLQLIKEQMKFLQSQALKILLEANVNAKLHSLPCNFVKKPNQVYSVYKKPTEEFYLSMLSPKEWGDSCPHRFIGSYKLESDMSWTPVDEYSASSACNEWAS